MKQRRIVEGRVSDRGEGLGTVTKKMVLVRAKQIAVISGRPKNKVLQSDLDQARRELEGRERLNPVPTRAENLPESKRWQPVPGSVGRKTPAAAAADEQTFAEKLVEEGVADAEHEQEIEATRESLRRQRK